MAVLVTTLVLLLLIILDSDKHETIHRAVLT